MMRKWEALQEVLPTLERGKTKATTKIMGTRVKHQSPKQPSIHPSIRGLVMNDFLLVDEPSPTKVNFRFQPFLSTSKQVGSWNDNRWTLDK
jgi:hypothetical protein